MDSLRKILFYVLTLGIFISTQAYVPQWDPNRGNNPGNRPGDVPNNHACGSISSVPQHLRSADHMWPKGLDYFYRKYTHAYGIPILGSHLVPDEALKRACYTVRFLFADRYDVRREYYKMFGRFALMAESEVTSSIPEHSDLGPGWDQTARGLGATWARPVSSAAEENALCYDRDRYRVEDILVHEFAHGVHLIGARLADTTFDPRLMALYNNAKATGLWRNTYAMSSDHEYFAEGVQSFFNCNGYANPPDGIHNHVNTNEKLRGYDPGLYSLIAEVFPCGNQYIKRCLKDRDAEMGHNLKMNCLGGGGVTTVDPPGPGDCVDNHESCAKWAAANECINNPIWMRENCKKSCRVCQPGGSTTETTMTTPKRTTTTPKATTTTPKRTTTTPKTTKTTATAPEITTTTSEKTTTTPKTTTTTQKTTTTVPIPTECVDNNRNCSHWALRDECRQNPTWMLENCRKACVVCQPKGDCLDNEHNCLYWASIGECQRNPDWMLINCKKSCTSCTGERECLDNHHQCMYWASIGECQKNPGWMLINCKKSCSSCIGEICVDRYFKCGEWAANNECANSYEWMKQHCKISCRYC